MNDQTFLLLLPILLLMIFLGFISVFQSSTSSSIMKSQSSLAEGMPPAPYVSDLNATCTCNLDGEEGDFCCNTDTPVLGGVDMVQFFTAFKISEGVYNETEIGQVGLPTHSSVYNGYTYRFISSANRKLFNEDPSHYVPQWGGFCAWGVATEGCPKYGWSATCMGPHGSWYNWTIKNDKIYFFWFATARLNFLMNVDGNVAAGDSRWSGWFGDETVISTNCVETSPDRIHDTIVMTSS